MFPAFPDSLLLSRVRTFGRKASLISLTLAMFAALAVVGAPAASAVPAPTSSVANNNQPMGFYASDGTAPNPASFCESPDYFDEWNNWDNPGAAGANGPWTIDTGAGQFGGGVTATLVQNSEPLLQGQAKWGIRFGGGAQGTVTLSQPIFYSQWVLSDMDINGEGFNATATYNGAAAPVTATAAFGANAGHTATANQPNMATVVKRAPGGVQPWNFAGRAQIDFLGPVDQVFFDKFGSSRWIAGFVPAMGCAAFGSSKEATEPATWDPATQTFSTQYTVLVRSNMPNAATIAAVLANAAATLPAADLPPGLPEIPIEDLMVTDSLVIAGSSIVNVSTSSSTSIAANLNPGYNGDTDTNLINPFDLAPQTTEEIVIDVEYAPDFDDPVWADGCHEWTNQTMSTAEAATAIVDDLSDDGDDPRAAETGGDNSTETPTPNSVCIKPEIEITKTLNGVPTLNADGTIDVTYDLLVENTGEVDLTNVSVTDDLAATFGAGSSFFNIVTTATGPCAGNTNANFNGTGNPELLAGGVTIPAAGVTSCIITLSFRVDPGNPVVLSPGTTYPNTADTSSAVGMLPEVEDEDDVPFTQVLPAEPAWVVEKDTTSVPENPGDTLVYTFDVVNTGNTVISGVTLTDAKCAAPPVLTSESVAADTALQLAETQVWTCTSIPVTAAEVDAGQVDNSVEATGTPEGGTLPPAEDDLSTPIDPDPSWTLVKDNTTMPQTAGDTIDYTFTIENTGNVTISNIVVSDAKCATPVALISESVTSNFDLEFAETQVYSCTSIPVTQAEVDAGVVLNSAAATGAPAGGDLPPAEDDHQVPIMPDPSFTVLKAATNVPGAAGDTIDYTFTLVNTGNVTISNVVLIDAKCATAIVLDSESIATNTILEVGETQIWSCTSIPVTQAEVDAGVVTNSVAATGDPAGGTLDPVQDDHDVSIDADPSWDIVKAAASAPANPGDTIDYTFTLVNTGNVTISNVVLTDAKCATGIVLDSESVAGDIDLNPGETQVWSCTSIPVTAAEVDAGVVANDVEASGDPAGGDLAPADDTHETPIEPAPGWVAAKTSTTVPTQAGDTIDYEFALTNTGNVSISNIVLTDIKCATPIVLDSESVAANVTLDYGETQVWSCTSIPVTQVEVDAGVVENSVEASGDPAGGDLPPATADHDVPVTPTPGWDIVKANTTSPTDDGDTIDYAFTLVNTGNVTINNVVLADAKCATSVVLDSESIAANLVLDAGETQVWSCTSIPVTQAEVDAGVVENSVEATGDPTGGDLPPAQDEEDTPIAPAPSWAVTKAAASVPSVPGDTIDYTFSVVNTGNVTIGNVALTDTKCATPIVLDTESVVSDIDLNPGETQVWSCTSIPVTAAEVDAGVVLNDVEVTGDPAGGTLPPAEDDHETPVTPAPSWAIVKSTASGPTEAGETIDYVFTIINTGNVTVTGVTVTDSKCDIGPTLDSESITSNVDLDYDETQIWKCTSIPVTQAEVDAGVVENEVQASGDPAGGDLPPAEDDHDLPIDPMPSWDVVKASTSTIGLVGETLDYTFTLINTGNVTIGGVALSDPKCDTAIVLDSESIAADIDLNPGETQVWSCTSIPVTQGEIDEGEVNNSVTATATSPGDLPPAEDDHTVPVDPEPAMEVVKSTSSTPKFEGDVLTYTFTVVNTGNVTINAVAVTDTKCATQPIIDTESIVADAVLDFGETQVWSCTSIPVTQAEVDAGVVENSVVVTGDPAGGVLPPAEDDHDTPVTPAPSWAVVKATSSAPTQVGDVLTYTFDVINTGNVTISNVVVTDAKCANPPVLDSESVAEDSELNYTETQVWSCLSIPVTQAEVDAGEILNAVEVTGDPAGGNLPPAEDDQTTPVEPLPDWEVTKAALTSPGKVGETIDYSFTLVNTGNVTITGVVVTDAKCATAPLLANESITANNDLEFGETQVWTCTSIPVTQAEVDAGAALNTVSVSGDPKGGDLPDASDEHEVPITADPSWEVIKASSNTPSQPGETIDYTFTVVNTGNVTVTGVVVTDVKCAAAPAIDAETISVNGILEFGETQIWSCTSIPVTAAEIDAGVVLNTVEVTGDPAGGELPPAVDDHDVPVNPLPGWVVAKTAANVASIAGDTIGYEFAVLNTGNVTISNVVLTDAKCASAITLDVESSISNGVLDFAETQVWSCESVPVTQAEIDAGVVLNTVEVTGDPAGGDLPPTTDDNASPIVPVPSWEVVKASSTVPGKAGDTIDYSFTLINTGNVTISNIVVTDVKCASAPALASESAVADGLLQPGESQIWACTSIPVTQAEVDAGVVENTVSVAGTAPGGDVPSAADDHTVSVDAAPAWSVAKSSSSAPVAPGDTLDYTFTVVNSGNVSITDVVVVDAKCATTPSLTFESVANDGVLQFGETHIWECTSIALTQAEVDAGEVLNTVAVTGNPAGGDLPPALGDHAVPLVQLPGWDLTKTTDSEPRAAGHTLFYEFTLTNTGNLTLTDVVLVDEKCALGPDLISGDTDNDLELDVGEVWEYTCTSIPVTQAEIAARLVENVATVSGSSPNGTIPGAVTAANSVAAVPFPSDPPFIRQASEPISVSEAESLPAPAAPPAPVPAALPLVPAPALAHTGRHSLSVAILALSMISMGCGLLLASTMRRREYE